MEKQNFYDLNFDQLKAFLIEKGEVEPKKAKMRSQQLFNAVYKKNIKSFDELTTFGAKLRNKINNATESLESSAAIRSWRPSCFLIEFFLCFLILVTTCHK